MRVLIYGLNFWPELTGIGKYTSEMAEWLSVNGHDIRMVTSPPYYPQWKIQPGYRAWGYKRDRWRHIDIERCPLWVPRRLSGKSRFFHLLSFAVSSLPVVLWRAWRWKPQRVVVIQPSFFCAPAAWLAARLAGAKLWLHIQDDELGAAFELGFLRGQRLKRLLATVERFWMARMDRVSTISSQMLARLAEKGVSQEKHCLFTNWVDTRQIRPVEAPNAFRQQLCLSNGDVVALYSGSMGRKQGLEYLVEAAEMLRDVPNIKIVLAGDGSMRPLLEASAARLANIRFLPLQPAERLNELLNLADIHLLMQRSMTSTFFMPSKLTGMLASGRPVIATACAGSELASAIENAGLLVPPENAAALAGAIRSLAEDSEVRRRLGAFARKAAAERWDKEGVLRQFERQLKEPALK